VYTNSKDTVSRKSRLKSLRNKKKFIITY